MAKRIEVSGIFNRSDSLVRFWCRFQAALIFPFWIFLPLFFIESKVGVGLLVVHTLLMSIIAIIGVMKLLPMQKLFISAASLIENHSNNDLIELFKKFPTNIFAILVLEFLLPITWPISFVFKFFFYKNLYRFKELIREKDVEDES